MAGDRDLTVAFGAAYACTYGGDLSGWEMLAATGVRGLRLRAETAFLRSLLLTESRADAAEVLFANSQLLGRPETRTRCADARTVPPEAPFEYVDLDPYGSPAPFLASALAAVADGGVLAVTATDMMVLAGVTRGACERQYGAVPIRGRMAPESGLRILLAYVARRAREAGRGISPLLAYLRDHHVRAYVRVGGAAAADVDPVRVIDPTQWEGPRLPPGGPFGPLWLGPLFDPGLTEALSVPTTAAAPEATALLIDRFRAEAVADRPFTYEPNELARALRLHSPPPLGPLLAELASKGHKVARSHARPSAFRTTAPRSTVEATAITVASAR